MIKNILIILIIVLLIIIYNKKRETFKSITLDVAVIVEPRKHKYLIPIIKDTLKKIPQSTKIQIFHGTHNIDFIKDNLKEEIDGGRIILTNLNKENIDRHYYSDLLTSKHFWDKIDGEQVLIFQTDSCLCSNPKHDIDYFLEYGYVGGPLKKNDDDNAIVYQNGGFSLRRKSAMLKAIKTKKKDENTWPCDFWFSQKKKYIVKPAPYKVAKDFAIERVYSDRPYGVHKPWAFLKKNELDKLRKDCPEIKTIFGK